MSAWEKTPKGKAYRKRWLATHKGQTYQRRNAWKARRDLLYFYLKNKPCADCYGWFEPCQMQFDHVRGVKIKIIAQLRRGALKKMLEEIKKCDIVCTNCHALRTFRRAQNDNKVRLTWDFARNILSSYSQPNKTRMFEPQQMSDIN